MHKATLCLLTAAALLLSLTPCPAQKPAKPPPPGGRSMREWMRDLEDDDPAVCGNAMAALQFFGRDARPATPILIKELRTKDASLRANAAIAIGLIGLDDKEVPAGVKALTHLLSDNQAIVRYQAALALGRLGVDAKPAIPLLLRTVRDRDSWEIRRASAFALGAAGYDEQNGPDMRAIGALLAVLYDRFDSCAQVRLAAVQGLIVLGQPSSSPADLAHEIRTLHTVLKNERSKILQMWVRMALMRIGGATEEQHMKAIGKNLKSPELQVRSNASWVLGSIGKEAKSQVPELRVALQDKSPVGAVWACWALSQMGKEATKALSELESLKDRHDNEGVRAAAAEAINRININSRARSEPDQKKPKIPPEQQINKATRIGEKNLGQWIEELTKSRDASVRENALATIRLYGPVALPAVPYINQELRSEDTSLRVNAAIALRAIGLSERPIDIKTSVNNLRAMLRDNEAIVRYQAAVTLAGIGLDAQATVPELVAVTKDAASWEIRKAAAFALGNIARGDRGADIRAVNALLGQLGDACAQVRLESVFSLILLGPPEKPEDRANVVKTLQRLVAVEKGPAVEIWGRIALMDQDKVSEVHTLAIGKHLKNGDAKVRAHAARALGVIGPHARSRVEDLKSVLEDKDTLVVIWAAWALGRIGEGARSALPALEQLTRKDDELVKPTAREAIDIIQAQIKAAAQPEKPGGKEEKKDK